MINKIIEGFYNFIFEFVGVFTGPVSNFLTNSFPDLNTYFSQVTTFINSLNSLFSWFIYLLPHPFTSTMLTIFLYFVASSASSLIAFYISGLIIDFIKRINIFGGK